MVPALNIISRRFITWVCAPLVAVLPAGAQFHATRFVSLLCGVLTLVLLWRSVRALWPDDPLLAALATGFARCGRYIKASAP
jgi:hypothetical protein